MNQQNWQKIMTSDAAALLDVLLKHEKFGCFSAKIEKNIIST